MSAWTKYATQLFKEIHQQSHRSWQREHCVSSKLILKSCKSSCKVDLSNFIDDTGTVGFQLCVVCCSVIIHTPESVLHRSSWFFFLFRPESVIYKGHLLPWSCWASAQSMNKTKSVIILLCFSFSSNIHQNSTSLKHFVQNKLETVKNSLF